MNTRISTTTIVGIALTLHVWLYAFAPFSLHAMDSIGFLQHNVWTIEDGLPMNTVNKIIQTHDGYLWLGTEAGLARFDGINFRVFNHEDTPAFSSNIVTSLMVDRSGTLWIGTRVGGIIRYKNGIFDTITRDSGLLDNDIWDIMESMDDSVWIGTGAGLNRIVNGNITEVSLSLSEEPNVNSPAVSCLMEDRNGCIWVGTMTEGLFWVEKRGTAFESEFVGLGKMHLTTLFEDRKGDAWIGTAENGLFKYLEDKRLSFTTKNGLSTNHVRCLHEDRLGNLWIGAEGGGISILTPVNNRISIYRSQEEFTSGGVLCFFEDREGTLWIGTDGRGLNSLRKTKITTYSTKNGLSYHNVYGVFQDSKNRIWVGTKGYGVNYFSGGRFHTLTTKNGLSSDSVVSIAEDPSGSLWLGTLGGGVNRYKDGRFQVFTSQHGLSGNFVRALYVAPEGDILVGTVSGGIHQFQDDRFTLLADVKSRVNVLHKDSNGYLWAGTLGSGLCRLKDGKIDMFDTRNGLSDNIVSSIHEDREGALWVGTLKGLDRIKNEKISGLLKKDGLPDDVVYCILEDQKHDFWISSNQGIYCLRRKDIDEFLAGRITRVTPVVYGREAGMRSVECNGGNQPPGWKSKDGKLWFPTTDGLSLIDPKNIGMNKLPPPVVIEKIVSDGISYKADKMIRVSPAKNNLEIHYTALSFIIPRKILFKYKMAGYDNRWIDAGPNRTAFYTDLPPGKYRFHVIACNSDGVWNETGTWVELHLRPKFYQTLPFKIFLILVAACFLGFLLFYLKKTIKQILKHKAVSRNVMLSREKAKEYIQKLLYLMEVEKIYKDPNLTIKSLSSKLIINSRILSQIINDHLNTNFYEFVNEFRIKEAQKILTDASFKHKSILDISYEVGYNSKSAFNRAFKNFTRVTPSEFRKKCGK
jgi:ligand-binding sensor domain-containing protein/AraC-like DNA-binding protein